MKDLISRTKCFLCKKVGHMKKDCPQNPLRGKTGSKGFGKSKSGKKGKGPGKALPAHCFPGKAKAPMPWGPVPGAPVAYVFTCRHMT